MWREHREAPKGGRVKRIARSNTGGPVKVEFQINDEFVFSTRRFQILHGHNRKLCIII